MHVSDEMNWRSLQNNVTLIANFLFLDNLDRTSENYVVAYSSLTIDPRKRIGISGKLLTFSTLGCDICLIFLFVRRFFFYILYCNATEMSRSCLISQ